MVFPFPFPPRIIGLCFIAFSVFDTFSLVSNDFIGLLSFILIEDNLPAHLELQVFCFFTVDSNLLPQTIHSLVNNNLLRNLYLGRYSTDS